MLVGNHSACLGNVSMCVMPLIQSTRQHLFLLQEKVVRREHERWPGFAGPWLHVYIQHLYITCFVAGADGSHGAVMNF